jgi:putative ABC transport system permease protein
MQESLAFMEKKWESVFPHRPFEYQFLDDKYDQLYSIEARIGQIFGGFAMLAIVIAALGLLGLSSYTILQRAKEISIRKVMGASVSQIAGMLSSSFLKLIGIAFVIALPIAWYLMNDWLSSFAYKVNIGIGTILIAAAFALLIGLLTVGYQSLRAGFTNPVDWLKDE